jgi:uncharacterized BrkB/YihY/UPF0761 family membrane protein
MSKDKSELYAYIGLSLFILFPIMFFVSAPIVYTQFRNNSRIVMLYDMIGTVFGNWLIFPIFFCLFVFWIILTVSHLRK